MHASEIETNLAKRTAGYAAAKLIPTNSLVGVGTGSTVAFFVQALQEEISNGLKIHTIPTSENTRKLLEKYKIPLADINNPQIIDITVDGADEIDPLNRMIKGGGGALVREKIVASSSKEMFVIVDSGKCVNKLGLFPLPVEIIPFGYLKTIDKLEKKGYKPILRQRNDIPYITDNGNFILDIHFASPFDSPEKEQEKIKNIPGVIDTGFFFDFAKKVIIGYPDGHFEIRT